MQTQRFKRGQIWWYQSSGSIGDKENILNSKTRPMLIVSNDIQNRNSNYVIAIPLTTADKKDYPFHTKCIVNEKQSTFLAESVQSCNKDYFSYYIETADDELMKSVENNLKNVLGLEQEKITLEVGINNIPIREPKAKPLTFEQYVAKNVEQKVEEVAPIFADDTPIEEKLSTRKAYEGVGRKGYQKYTKEQMLRFVNDCENHTIAWVTKKYNCTSEKATSNKLYRFRKFLKENP